MIAVLGVDPTATGSGAAVLRVDGAVAGWWAWTLTAKGWRVRYEIRGVPVSIVYDRLDDVGLFVGSSAPCVGARLVVEGLFAPPKWMRRASGADVIALAEATGATIAGLRRAGLPEPARPTAREWRTPLGLAGLTAQRAESAAIEAAMREGWLPRGLTLAEQGATSEAGAMARWVV